MPWRRRATGRVKTREHFLLYTEVMRVAFFQPFAFNRSPQRTNPFLDPLIAVCEEHGIEWKIFESAPKCSPSGYKNIRSSWKLTLSEILGFRLIKWFHLPEPFVWRVMGALVNLVTWGEFRADICFVSAQVDLPPLQGVNPHGRLVDVQHGVIYSRHSGYFDQEQRLRAGLRVMPRVEFWLYGEGYRQCFFRNAQNAESLVGRVAIVGDLLGVSRSKALETQKSRKKDALVFSLQFTDSLSREQLNAFLEDILEILGKMEQAHLNERYRILLKHHPRFGNCFDLSEIARRFPWAEISEEQTVDLIARACYHITAHSTTAFEYAAAGVPTLFFGDPLNPEWQEVFYKEYEYPLFGGWETMCAALESGEEMARQSKIVEAWQRRFYHPFSAEHAWELMTHPLNRTKGENDA